MTSEIYNFMVPKVSKHFLNQAVLSTLDNTLGSHFKNLV